MRNTKFASFDSDLPAEPPNDDEPPGLPQAEAIHRHLQQAGYTVTEPQMLDFYAWAFHMKVGKRRFWLMVGMVGAEDPDELPKVGPWRIFVEYTPGILWFRRVPEATLRTAIEAVDNALKSLPGIRMLRWHDPLNDPEEVLMFSIRPR